MAADLDSLGEQDQQEHIARFREITEAPYEVLGAPRVGTDAAADEWVLQRLRENNAVDQFDDARQQMAGYYVLDLLPRSPGLPFYTSRGYEGVDGYTFRGSFLQDAASIIGTELHERAFTRMTAATLHAYGEQLLDAARAFAAPRGLGWIEGQFESPTDDEETDESRVHIVFSAAAWCLWWSARGFGLEPWW
jgi:hypothetical protein